MSIVAALDEWTGVLPDNARAGDRRALLLVDLDHFAQFTDTWGRPAGDDVLAAVVGVVRAQVRAEDRVCRFSGDEIVVLLSGPRGAGTAGVVAERIRRGIEALGVVVDSTAGPVMLSGTTASVGGAVHIGSGDVATLLWTADQALYEAKSGGGNVVCLHRPPRRWR